MVRMLMVNDASPISRSDRRSCSTSPPSQRRLNGASVVTTLRAARSSTASPAQTCAQSQLVDGARSGAGRRVGIGDEDDVLLWIGAGEEASAAVGEQQHDRRRILETQQMAPAQANRARPDAGVLRPQRQCRRRRSRVSLGVFGNSFGIKLDAMMARGLNHRLQRRMQWRVACRIDAQRPALVARHYGSGINPALFVHGRSFQQAM